MDWIQSTLFPTVSVHPTSPPKTNFVPISVNYFPHRQCNYSCAFCFHTTKNMSILPLDEAKRGLRMLADAGMKKLNISGGEPFLKAEFIGEIFKFCKEELRLESCSIVNNGSKVTEKWLDTYGEYLDVMAISCDSSDPETNLSIGRSENGTAKHIGRVFQVAEWCRKRNIKVKINSVINSLNWEEDMNASMKNWLLFDGRYFEEVFQILLLDGENTGSENRSIRNGRKLVISDEQFQAFLKRHAGQKSLVPEDNKAMKDSHLLLDEEMRFLNSSDGGKKPGRSVLKAGVQAALDDAGFDNKTFIDRGGIFEWTRMKSLLRKFRSGEQVRFEPLLTSDVNVSLTCI